MEFIEFHRYPAFVTEFGHMRYFNLQCLRLWSDIMKNSCLNLIMEN